MPIARYLQGIKDDPRAAGALSSLIQVESGGNPSAVSPKGALGLTQIMPGTARDLGVNPLDPTQAKAGATKYLSWLLKETGSLPDALAAYNTGLGNWKKNRSNLPRETVDYVKRVMGLLTKQEQGLPPPTVASTPLNPQAPEEKDAETDSAPPETKQDTPPPEQVASLAPGPSPQFQGYDKISNPPSQFMGKNNPIAMVEALLQDPTSLSRGEGRANMAGGGAVKKMLNALYKKAGPEVAGMAVRKEIPNTSSIRSTLSNYEELPGIREVPMHFFSDKNAVGVRPYPASPKPYSVELDDKMKNLAAQLLQSKEINPLIVAHGKEGPFIVEGNNRFNALKLMGKDSFPALVLRDFGDYSGGGGYAEGGAVIRKAPRNKILGALSDLVNGADEHVLKPAQEYAAKAPGVNEALSAGLGLPLVYQYLTGDKPKPLSWLVPRLNSLGGVLEDASYGMPLTTGKGMTTGIKPDVAFAALDASQLPAMGRGVASLGRGVKPLAAKMLPKRAAPDVMESMFGPEAEWKAAKKAWDSAQGFAGGGAVRGALRRIAKMLGPDEVPAKLLPLQAVKEQGGQWLPGSAKKFVQGPTPWPDHLKKPHEEWAEKALPKYIEKYMGAKGDPLADVQIPHGREMKRWEELTDPLVARGQKSFLMSPEHPEWLKNLPPETWLYSLIGNTSPAKPVQDYISHVLDHASTIPPEKLKQYDFPRLVKEVQKIDAERAAKMASVEGRAEGTTKFKEYPEGFHWAEVQSPEALKREGDIMGHCVGGYCDDVKAGRKKIYSLRDPKGESHATVEVRPSDWTMAGLGQNEDMYKAFTAYQHTPESKKFGNRGFPEWLKASNSEVYGRHSEAITYGPSDIGQIKGKQNLAPKPEYQQYIQDLIRSGKYGEVRDLQNSGLQPIKNLDRAKYPTGELSSDVVKALQERHGDYITPKEIDEYLKSISPGIPQMRKGGAVKKACSGGVTCPCIKCSRKRFEHRV